MIGQSGCSHRMVISTLDHRGTVGSADEGMIEAVPVAPTFGRGTAEPRIVHRGGLHDPIRVLEPGLTERSIEVVLPSTEHRVTRIVNRLDDVEITSDHNRPNHIKNLLDSRQRSRNPILERTLVPVTAILRATRRNVEAGDTNLASGQDHACRDAPMSHRADSNINRGELDIPGRHEHPESVIQRRLREEYPEAVVRQQAGQDIARPGSRHLGQHEHVSANADQPGTCRRTLDMLARWTLHVTIRISEGRARSPGPSVLLIVTPT